MGVAGSVAIELELSAGVWTDVTTDLVASEDIRVQYGTRGRGPLDLVAATGTCEFTLRNDAGNSGSQQGWYSPNHASKRAGFTFGIGMRLKLTDDQPVQRTKFRGKLAVIDPVAGQYGVQRTRCIATDWIDEAATFTLRDVGIQASKRSDQLIQVVIDAMPASARPVSTNLDVGKDTYPWAFFNIGHGVSALTMIQRIVQSERGWFNIIGDALAGGVARFEHRHARATKTSAGTLSNTMRGLTVPTSLQGVFNRVRTTTHPVDVDAAATTVLCKLIDKPSLAPSETQTFWLDYRDPNNKDNKIGGTAFVDPPVSGTDWTANSAADGTGTNLTSSVAVTATFFATVAKFVVTNNATSTAYLTLLQGRGKGIYDLAAKTHESSSSETYERPIEIDLPFQNDTNIGQGVADQVRNLWGTLIKQVDTVSFLANDSSTLLRHAVLREPGDKITLTETMTGLSSLAVFIQGVEMLISASQWIEVTYSVAPADTASVFILDDAVAGTLDNNAIGYA